MLTAEKQSAVDWCQSDQTIWGFHDRPGSKWVAPLLPSDFQRPIHYRWPEYVSTIRGVGLGRTGIQE